MKKYYISTPLYYVNAAPHIGHAYTQVACDSISRFMKQMGREVYFMTGTDEHGEKIEKAAEAAGFERGREKDFVDTIIPRFTTLWEKLNIKYDYFIRTSEEHHKNTVRHILNILHDKGDIYKKTYHGWFCTPCESFWSETQAPKGVCPDCGRQTEKLDEENYFFRTSKYQAELISRIEKDELLVRPGMRKNEVLAFLKGNELQDLCISRPRNRLGWGIGLPFDDGFVTYVWVDALINYVSGAGYPHDEKKFMSVWPADMHMIGKDIIRHHAVYWTIILLGIGMPLPRKIFAHGWWVMGGEKMSKSKGNIVDPLYLLDEKRYQVDAFRYYLLSQVEFGWDGTFSEELLIEKYNSDLANDIGNLLNRSITMVEKYFGGEIPEALACDGCSSDEINSLSKDLYECAVSLPEKVSSAMAVETNGPDFQSALKAIWSLIDRSNKYIERCAPWKCAKADDKKALQVIMGHLMQSLGITAALLYPFMPETACKLITQIGADGYINCDTIRFSDIKWGMIRTGTKVAKGAPVFPRLEKEK